MQPAYPNPSHASDPVTLPLDVPTTGAADGKLVILDSAGERVRTIELHGLTPGVTPITWDGRNDAGRSVAPGVYRAWLTVGGTQQVSKLVRQP
jgi:flagellar hook assembly protein FlgD